MRTRLHALLAVSVTLVTASACDEPERRTRSPGYVAPGPKGDDTQDGKPGVDDEAPVFVQPDESETTVALNSGKCVEVDMALSDDADRLQISVDAPAEITGATLTEDAAGYAAHWRWCPGAFGEPPPLGTYEIMLIADDGTHLPTTKAYDVIVIEGEPAPEPKPDGEEPPVDDCDKGWPTVDYQPASVADGVATISALFIDDGGIVGFPMIEFTFVPPGEEVTDTTMLPMALSDGDRLAGVWVVQVPLDGQTLYYRYLAEDTVAGQPCGHVLQDPSDGFLQASP